jgi:uncharacterized membrane protein YphA (DoxX/SURF4 family)
MATSATASRTASPTYQAYQILHIAFTVAPLVAGVDKFFHFLVNWDQYLSPMVSNTLHVAPHTFMLAVGVIEIVAGLLVAFVPTIGAWIVGAWLCGIILNLLSIPGYFDIALRDLGLALGSFAFARLASEFDTRTPG